MRDLLLLFSALLFASSPALAQTVPPQWVGASSNPLDFTPIALSGDGNVVLGEGGRWTAGSGLTPLSGTFPTTIDVLGDPVSVNRGANVDTNHDGSVVLTSYEGCYSGLCFRDPVLWREGVGYDEVAYVPNSFGSVFGSTNGGDPLGLSGDASVIVGSGLEFPPVGFAWSVATQSDVVSVYDDFMTNQMVAVSFDGSATAGFSEPHDPRGSWRSYRWSESDGFEVLEDSSPLQSDFRPEAISADGAFVVGSLSDPSGSRAARVGASGVIDRLELPAGFSESYALDTSMDGGVVLGMMSDGASGLEDGFLWTPTGGTQRLSVLLAVAGLDVDSWLGFSALEISDDGSTLIGSYQSSTGGDLGWIVVVPEPSVALLMGLGLAMMSDSRRERSP